MNTDNKAFLANFFHLTFLKAISRIFPLLITTPFLIRTIGIEKFGTLEFAKAVSFYFTVFISYGFKYSATKQVNLNKNNKFMIGKIVSSVYALKIIIIAICLVIMFIIIAFIPKINQNSIYIISFFPIVIASSLFPTFVFQGLNKMHWLTLINLITKIIFIISLFIVIKEPKDAIMFPILLGAVDTLRLAIAILFLYYNLSIPMQWPVSSIMADQMREGLHIFLSQLANMFYLRFPTLFLGIFAGPTVVAMYALGDRIIRTTESMLEPFMQAIYPIAHQKISKSIDIGVAYIKYFAKISTCVLCIIGIIYLYFSNKIIYLIAGTYIPEAAKVFRLHAFLPILILLSNLLGISILIPLKAGSKYIYTLLLTGLITIASHFILVPLYKIQGAAWAILFSEIFGTLLLFILAYREINILKHRA